MDTKLRQRIIGGIVLAALAIIFLPIFFKGSNSVSPPSQVAISEQIPPQPAKPSASSTSELQTANAENEVIPPEEKNKVVKLTRQGDTLVASVSEAPQTQTAEQPAPAPSTTTEASVMAPVSQAISEQIAAKPVAERKKSNSDEASVSQTLNAAEEKVLSTKTMHAAEEKIAPTKTMHAAEPAISSYKAKLGTKESKEKPKAITLGAWAVQLGSFAEENRAKNLIKELQTHGFTAYLEKTKTPKGMMNRVLIGPETKRAKAEAIISKLDNELQIKGVVVPYDVKLFK